MLPLATEGTQRLGTVYTKNRAPSLLAVSPLSPGWSLWLLDLSSGSRSGPLGICLPSLAQHGLLYQQLAPRWPLLRARAATAMLSCPNLWQGWPSCFKTQQKCHSLAPTSPALTCPQHSSTSISDTSCTLLKLGAGTTALAFKAKGGHGSSSSLTLGSEPARSRVFMIPGGEDQMGDRAGTEAP